MRNRRRGNDERTGGAGVNGHRSPHGVKRSRNFRLTIVKRCTMFARTIAGAGAGKHVRPEPHDADLVTIALNAWKTRCIGAPGDAAIEPFLFGSGPDIETTDERPRAPIDHYRSATRYPVSGDTQAQHDIPWCDGVDGGRPYGRERTQCSRQPSDHHHAGRTLAAAARLPPATLREPVSSRSFVKSATAISVSTPRSSGSRVKAVISSSNFARNSA